MTPEQFNKLPRYARNEIVSLRSEIESLKETIVRLESTLPWTKNGMEWFTLFSHLHEPLRIFTCNNEGTRLLCSLGENDRLFVGRDFGR